MKYFVIFFFSYTIFIVSAALNKLQIDYNLLQFCGANNGFGWLNEYPNILLDNTSDITPDVSDVPIDGQYHKAKITIDGLSVSSDIDWLSKVQCNLTELELL